LSESDIVYSKYVKVLFLLNNLKLGKDGVADYTWKLSRQFVEHDVDVHFVTSSVNSDVKQSNISLIETWGWSAINEINREIKRINPDWVIIQYVPFAFHARGFAVWLIFLLLRIRPGRKIGIFFHEVSDRFYWDRPKRFISAVANTVVANSLAALSNIFFTSIQFYRRYFVMAPRLIPIGSNVDVMVHSGDAMHRPLVISTFGTRSVGDFKLFFDALEILRQKQYDFKVVIMGINEVNEIASLAHARGIGMSTVVTGFLSEQEIARNLSDADIFVNLNLVYEKNRGGTCLKSGSLAAAFAAGKAIVGFHGDMTDSILQDNYNIILCDKPDAKTLASKIEMVLTNSGLRSELQKNALSFYSQHLSWPSIFRQFCVNLGIDAH
jgi:glycosyltransferase involved in cell wall biosynthesis